MNWAKLEARVGELIRPKWRELLRWARSMRFRPGAGILWRQTPNGVLVWAKPRGSYPSAFPVGIGSTGFTVGVGTLDGVMPAIDGVTLDGIELATQSTVTRPILPFGDPPKDGVCWVTLQASDDPTLPGTVVVADQPGTGQDLALVRWVNDRPSRVFQIARHNYASGATAPDATGKRGRFYWAV